MFFSCLVTHVDSGMLPQLKGCLVLVVLAATGCCTAKSHHGVNKLNGKSYYDGRKSLSSNLQTIWKRFQDYRDSNGDDPLELIFLKLDSWSNAATAALKSTGNPKLVRLGETGVDILKTTHKLYEDLEAAIGKRKHTFGVQKLSPRGREVVKNRYLYAGKKPQSRRYEVWAPMREEGGMLPISTVMDQRSRAGQVNQKYLQQSSRFVPTFQPYQQPVYPFLTTTYNSEPTLNTGDMNGPTLDVMDLQIQDMEPPGDPVPPPPPPPKKKEEDGTPLDEYDFDAAEDAQDGNKGPPGVNQGDPKQHGARQRNKARARQVAHQYPQSYDPTGQTSNMQFGRDVPSGQGVPTWQVPGAGMNPQVPIGPALNPNIAWPYSQHNAVTNRELAPAAGFPPYMQTGQGVPTGRSTGNLPQWTPGTGNLQFPYGRENQDQNPSVAGPYSPQNYGMYPTAGGGPSNMQTGQGVPDWSVQGSTGNVPQWAPGSGNSQFPYGSGNQAQNTNVAEPHSQQNNGMYPPAPGGPPNIQTEQSVPIWTAQGSTGNVPQWSPGSVNPQFPFSRSNQGQNQNVAWPYSQQNNNWPPAAGGGMHHFNQGVPTDKEEYEGESGNQAEKQNEVGPPAAGVSSTKRPGQGVQKWETPGKAGNRDQQKNLTESYSERNNQMDHSFSATSQPSLKTGQGVPTTKNPRSGRPQWTPGTKNTTSKPNIGPQISVKQTIKPYVVGTHTTKRPLQNSIIRPPRFTQRLYKANPQPFRTKPKQNPPARPLSSTRWRGR